MAGAGTEVASCTRSATPGRAVQHPPAAPGVHLPQPRSGTRSSGVARRPVRGGPVPSVSQQARVHHLVLHRLAYARVSGFFGDVVVRSGFSGAAQTVRRAPEIAARSVDFARRSRHVSNGTPWTRARVYVLPQNPVPLRRRHPTPPADARGQVLRLLTCSVRRGSVGDPPGRRSTRWDVTASPSGASASRSRLRLIRSAPRRIRP